MARGDRDVKISWREPNWRVRKKDRIHLGYFGGGCCHRAGSNSLVLIFFLAFFVSAQTCNHGLSKFYFNSIKE